MANKEIILVTGAGDYWGSRLAARLVRAGNYHVIGLDAETPAAQIEGLDFIQADVRNPLLADLFRAERVEVVCHLAFVEATRPSEAAFDLNVMGTTKVLGACAEAGVRKAVLKSSTAVYGARPSNPAFLSEEHALRGSKRYGYTRDLVEIEAFCQGFRHRVPDMLLTVLRFANIVGPTADTPMTRFLKEAWAPSLLGFDPMIQVVHEDDVVEALFHAILHDVPGVFNVAAKDGLPLSKVRGLGGKALLPVFHPLAYWGVGLFGRRAVSRLGHYMPLDPDCLRYPWVADLSRMHEELAFEPQHPADETLREFAERNRQGRYTLGPAGMSRDEERLRSLIEQRRHTRGQHIAAAEQGGDNE